MIRVTFVRLDMIHSTERLFDTTRPQLGRPLDRARLRVEEPVNRGRSAAPFCFARLRKILSRLCTVAGHRFQFEQRQARCSH